MSRIVSLGLVQMRMTDNPQRNFAVAVEGIREAAKRGAQIVCLNCFGRSTSVRARITGISRWRNRSPVLRPRRWAHWRANSAL